MWSWGLSRLIRSSSITTCLSLATSAGSRTGAKTMPASTSQASLMCSAGTFASKMVASLSVEALMDPPTLSIASETARAVGKRPPPLNTTCSMKWLSPAVAPTSYRDPTPNMNATAADLRSRIGVAISRAPLDRRCSS